MAMGLSLVAAAAAVDEEPEWTAPPEEAARPNPQPADPESLARGRAAYFDGCAPCHGESGDGSGPMAEVLAEPPGDLTAPGGLARETDGALWWKIRTGNQVMPGFAGDLEEARLWDVVNYVRTLERPAPGE